MSWKEKNKVAVLKIKVETPVLQEKSVTPTKMSQTVEPDSSYDGLSKVTVGAISPEYVVPVGIKYITENGLSDVKNYAQVNVNVPSSSPTLQEKTVTSNGEYTADSSYDGLSKVTVAIPIYTGGTV